jgi:hypothetical protein
MVRRPDTELLEKAVTQIRIVILAGVHQAMIDEIVQLADDKR